VVALSWYFCDGNAFANGFVVADYIKLPGSMRSLLVTMESSFTFDFQKKFIFKSLPAYFANQRLCPGQPSSPLNFNLYENYLEALQTFKEQHVMCLNCDPSTIQRHDIADLIVLEPETCIQYLPLFISLQYLFEDEPVAVSSNIEEFYQFYITDFPLATCPDKEQVIKYHHHLIHVAYPEALKKWKDGLTTGKRLRYQLYCTQRDRLYQDLLHVDRLSIKTTTDTVANANAANPMTL